MLLQPTFCPPQALYSRSHASYSSMYHRCIRHARSSRRGCSRAHSHSSSSTSTSSVVADGVSLLRPLLIDNYDSYTYNLYQIISEVYGVAPLVVQNDAVGVQQVLHMLDAGEVHHIILSPGPGSPGVPQDIGVCMDVLQQCPHTPVLGVCLGHQALALAAGGSVVRAPEPVHGRLSSLRHTGHPLFRGCPSGPGAGFDVVRYHSLLVDAATLPEQLQPIAWTVGAHQALAVQQQVQPDTPTQGTARMMQPAATANAEQDTQPQQPRQQQQQQQSPELVMALAHRSRPHYGVQFHPESIASQYGIQVLLNFRDLAYAASGQQVPQHLAAAGLNGKGPPGRAMQPWPWPVQQNPQQQKQQQVKGQQQQCLLPAAAGAAGAPPAAAAAAASLWPAAGLSQHLALVWRKLPQVLSSVGGSLGLFAALVGPQPDTFWLDSSSAPQRARFSYMGGSSGPLWRRITYKLPHPQQQQQQRQVSPAGVLCVSDHSGQQQSSSQLSVWDYLQTQLAALQLQPSAAAAAAEALPFNFWGGFVGYLGYELKAECGGSNTHAADSPDAAWQFVDRLIVGDHVAGDVYLLALHDAAAGAAAAAQQWMQDTAAAVCGLAAPVPPAVAVEQQQLSYSSTRSLGGSPVVAAAAVEAPARHLHSTNCLAEPVPVPVATQRTATPQQHLQQQQHEPHQQQQQQHSAGDVAPLPPGVRLRHSRQQYLSNVAACQEALHAGESYELCLTTALEAHSAPDPWQYYRQLRTHNPAPYAAWLSFGGSSRACTSSSSDTRSSSSPLSSPHSSPCSTPAVVVCCSSPERFLQGGRGGLLEAKPIKGTARRSSDPQADAAAAAALQGSEKERAENLMIVDLLRNDLGKVCEPGSVHVPGLVQLESYAGVHQLVSTVRGLRRAGVSGVEAIRAAFPGGSMTGAPKVRSMALLNGLEGAARGVYSGALGYLSVNDTFDLNIVIRSAVFVERQQQGAAAADEGEQLAGDGDCVGVQGCGSNSSSSKAPPGPSSGQGQLPPAARLRMSVGAGGAIVVQSDPASEFAEMQLKAERLLQTVLLAQQAAADDS